MCVTFFLKKDTFYVFLKKKIHVTIKSSRQLQGVEYVFIMLDRGNPISFLSALVAFLWKACTCLHCGSIISSNLDFLRNNRFGLAYSLIK